MVLNVYRRPVTGAWRTIPSTMLLPFVLYLLAVTVALVFPPSSPFLAGLLAGLLATSVAAWVLILYAERRFRRVNPRIPDPAYHSYMESRRR
jgi:L-asparagine transporter-like permease